MASCVVWHALELARALTVGPQHEGDGAGSPALGHLQDNEETEGQQGRELLMGGLAWPAFEEHPASTVAAPLPAPASSSNWGQSYNKLGSIL